jgi:hypothetical protein
MRTKTQVFLSLFVVFLVPSPAKLQEPKTNPVTIVVTDPTGTLVQHAKIRLTPPLDSAPATLETNEKGELTVSLKSGGYGLLVEAPGFKSYKSHLQIPDGKAGETVLVTLQIADTGSPMVMPASAKDDLLLYSFPNHAPVAISPSDFKSLIHTTVTVQNAHNNTQENYSGVRVSELLVKLNAPLGSELRGKAMTSYVRATGSDGYQVVFSIAEIDPAFHSGEIIVADQMNGSRSTPNPAPSNWSPPKTGGPPAGSATWFLLN